MKLHGRSQDDHFDMGMGKTMRDESGALVIRVLVADDTRLHTQLLADALRRDGAFEVSGSDSEELIARADLHNIDVLLLSSDLDEQPARGFEVLRKVRTLHPNIRAVMLLDSSKNKLVLDAFRAGAQGVLSRQESIETLCKCVRSVHGGQIWANSQQMGLVIQALFSSQELFPANAQGIDELSKREMEVVDSVARGLTNRKIAERLGLSEHTVKNYLFRVFDKLGVSNRFELLSLILGRMEQSESTADSAPKYYTDPAMLSDSTLSGCRRAAEQGAMIAQFELARFYWTRRADAKDLIQAYKWYLIGSQQLLQTSKRVVKVMTLEQKLEAEQLAAEWLRKAQKPSPVSIRDQVIVPAATTLPMGSD